jgi:signal transduction histidine kinase/DNA-binding response OmpR family regulator
MKSLGTNSTNLTEPDIASVVLIVDDDPGMRLILRQYMEEQKHHVLEAENGIQAVAVCRQHRPHVVLLDALMPVMDGFTCCHKLLSLHKDYTPLVLMITSLSHESSISRAFEVGATDYVMKPINGAILQQRVRRLVQQSHLMQQVQQYNRELEHYAQTSNLMVRERTAQLHRALEIESTLKRITDRIRDSLDETQILQTAMQELALTLGLEYCGIRIYDSEQATGHRLYEYNSSITGYLSCIAFIDAFSTVYQSLLNGNSAHFCAALPCLQKQVSSCIFPIQNGHLLGDLWLICESDRVLDDLEMRLAQQIANQCAIGIRQAHLYQTAQNQVKELERLNELKDDFLSTVSHELRSPVTNMRLAIQFLERLMQEISNKGVSPDLNTLLAKSRTYLHILHIDCEREINLINDLLDLQRLEAGKHSFDLTNIQLQNWLPQQVAPFTIRVQTRQQILQIHLADDLPPLESDPNALKRILAELINNACKYSPFGASITVTATTTTNQIQLSITNSGIEIPKDEFTHIFEKFYRITGGDPWKQGGTGLGLALVKRLIEQLGGSIQVASGAGKTCFTLRFNSSKIGIEPRYV